MFDRKSDELAILQGLSIKDYPGKWKQAIDAALRMDKDDYPESNAYELAARLFVELGGKVEGNFYDLLNAETIK